MDLWDVTKLLAKHWLISVPLLVVTIGGALWMGVTTEPDYKATTHVTLLPASVTRSPTAGATQTVNPWTTESLLSAVVTRLNSKALHDQLEAEGLSPIWEAEPDLRFDELVAIEVTARGEQQARDTAKRLQDIVTEEVAKQQARYNLKPGEQITTIPFDSGENVLPARSKIYRVMIVIVGVGGVLTVALVVAVDALQRRRSRRGLSGDLVEKAVEPASVVRQEARSASAPPSGPIVPTSVPIAIRTISSSTGKSGANGNTSSDETTRIVTTDAGRNGQSRSSEPPAVVERTSVIEPFAERFPVTEDATVVLPLSNAPWSGGKSDKK